MFQDYMLYGIVPNIKKCEENQNSFRSDRSSEDRNSSDVLAIIVKSIQDEKEDEMFYKMLIDSTVNKEDKEIILYLLFLLFQKLGNKFSFSRRNLS